MLIKERQVKRIALIVSTVIVLSVFVGAFVVLSKTNFNAIAVTEVETTTEKASDVIGGYMRVGVFENETNPVDFDDKVSETKEVVTATEKAETTTEKVTKQTTTVTKEEKTTVINKQETTVAYKAETNAYQATINDIIRLTNAEREKEGLKALSVDVKMQPASTQRAKEVATLFSHTRPDGKKWSSVFKQFGINDKKIIGENVATGYTDAEELVDAWMASETHRANIMNENFTEISIGIYEEDGVLYWSQLFAG